MVNFDLDRTNILLLIYVICLGNATQKLMAYHVVTPEDDPVAQRHELLGTSKIYQELTEKALLSDGMDMKIMCPSPNRLGKSRYRQNQLDKWHALKQLERALKAISTRPKKYH